MTRMEIRQRNYLVGLEIYAERRINEGYLP